MEPKVWILGGLVSVLIPTVGWFALREIRQKDGLVDAINRLTYTVSELKTSIESVRLWATERFVSRLEHRELVEMLKSDIQKHADRFERELGEQSTHFKEELVWCQKTHPGERS